MNVPIPGTNAGDMVFRHSAVPVRDAKEPGVFIPVAPLPRVEVNVNYVQSQREAFEAGLPPLHARAAGTIEGGGLVELEAGGERGSIQSSGGRRAMGYA